MDTEIQNRCNDLLAKGKAYAANILRYGAKPNYWFSSEQTAELQAWIASSANVLKLVATPDTYYHQECERVISDDSLRTGVPYHTVQKLVGLLESILEEFRHGLLRKAEYIFVASTFDDFLDHASEYHKAGRKIESSILVSAVFEDTIRKIASKHGISQSGVSLDSLVDEFSKRSIITPVKAKRIKGYAAVRNQALHAQWDEFDLSDAGQMISGTKEMIDTYL